MKIPFPSKHQRPQFPSTDDLCNLSLNDARRALHVLRVLVDNDLATVYTSAGSNDTRWNVWLEVSRRRVPLPEWAAEVLAGQEPDGGDAA